MEFNTNVQGIPTRKKSLNTKDYLEQKLSENSHVNFCPHLSSTFIFTDRTSYLTLSRENNYC